MSVPSLESLLDQHTDELRLFSMGDPDTLIVQCSCGMECGPKRGDHAAHVAAVIREQWLTAEYCAAGTEGGPDMDWNSEDTWATPADAEEWQRRTQNQGWVERRYVSEWVRLADEAEVQQ